MQYRKYGKDGPDVSVLGFGVMRLPMRGKKVLVGRSTQVLRKAMELGVNFFDSHHGYLGGQSETAIGRALKGWKGHRVYVQTKTPFYRPEPIDYYKRLLHEALEKLGVESIDYLFFHSLNMDKLKKRGRAFFRFTDWALKRGMIRHRGFSSHDTPENVRAFVDTGEFSAMLVSYNWLVPDMGETIGYAASKGMGVAVMNPVGGGNLVGEYSRVLRLLPGAKTSIDVGMRFVMGTPGVSVALSGMSEIAHVEQNAALADRKTHMTDRQRRIIHEKLAQAKRAKDAFCTACGYCMSCPSGVDIPENLALAHQATFFGLTNYAGLRFKRMVRRETSALSCKKCGLCLPKCPNSVEIIERLAETAELLG